MEDETETKQPTRSTAGKRPNLTALNQDAVRLARAGDHEGAVAALTRLFEHVAALRLTRQDLHVCHCNRAHSLLALGKHEEALQDAQRCVELMKASMPGGQYQYHPLHVKAIVRRGQALLGMARCRDALHAFEEALKLDPSNADARLGLQAAEKQALKDALEGRHLERRALPTPAPDARIAYLPHSAPVHHMKSEDYLPHELLTPFQAERDHATRDVYNYVTIQADIRKPRWYLDKYLTDGARLEAVQRAVAAAVHDVRHVRGLDCRVLVLGAGAGLVPLMALRAGAFHVTCVERWLYLAQACREVLLSNGADPTSFAVLAKRPSDLTREDVPIPCNLVIAEGLLDDGLLTGGIMPAVSHALQSQLALPDAAVVPSSLSVRVQALQVGTAAGPGGLSLGGLDRYRWLPTPSAGAPLPTPTGSMPGGPGTANTGRGGGGSSAPGDRGAATSPGRGDSSLPAGHDTANNGPGRGGGSAGSPSDVPETLAAENAGEGGSVSGPVFRCLSGAQDAWRFDLLSPPDGTGRKHVELEFTGEGSWNACAYWGEVRLYGDVTLSTCCSSPVSSIQPALQYLAGPLRVRPGAILPLLATHNTIRLSFDLEEGEYEFLHRHDASLPGACFASAADGAWLAAYAGAIERSMAALRRDAEQGGEIVALDLGAGSGALAMLAARAGAGSVVAVECHEGLCAAARKNVALNGLGRRVTVVQADGSDLQRGRHLPFSGAHLAVFDLFDEGLLGGGVLPLLRRVRQQVLRPGATVLPAAATLYCLGVQVLTGDALGFDLSALNRFRWSKGYQAVRMGSLPHRVLTPPTPLLHVDFAECAVRNMGGDSGSGSNGVRLEVLEGGVLNAVVMWFDLHLDAQTTITTAPPGFGLAGTTLACSREDAGPSASPVSCHHLGQALQYLDCALPVKPGHSVPLMVSSGAAGTAVSVSLPDGVGMPVPKSPWLVEWGGGASVESPHRQRVLYCELLVQDLLQRLPSGRFPSVEEDLKVMVAHCGSLYLDAAILAEVYLHLCLMERLYKEPHRLPSVLPEHVSRPQLRWG